MSTDSVMNGSMKKNAILTIQPSDIKILLLDNNLHYTAQGHHQTSLVFKTVTSWSRAINVLYEAGYNLISPKMYAKKYGISKQLLHYRVYRDGKLIQIVYDDGRQIIFIVDGG